MNASSQSFISFAKQLPLAASRLANSGDTYIEFTPIFAHWLCADCNRQLQSLLDVLPASQIKPYLLRLFAMGRAVQGGVTSRRDEPETESDGYDASLEAMFEGLS